MTIKTLFVGIALVSLAACGHVSGDKPPPGFGEANARNMQAQANAVDEAGVIDGARMGLAAARYRVNRSKEPERLRSSTVVAPSGGNGAGAGSPSGGQ